MCPSRRPPRPRLRRQQARRAGAGRAAGPGRVRRADLVRARLREVHREDRAERSGRRGRGRVAVDRLAGRAPRGAARRGRRSARGRQRFLVRRRRLAPRRGPRRARRRGRPADHLLEPGRRPLPRRRLQEALGRALHQHGRRLRQVREAAVRDVRTGRGRRRAGRRRPRPAGGAQPVRGRRPHRGARAHRAGTERLALPARPRRRHGEGDRSQRRARRRRLDRGRARRRGPRDGPRGGPDHRLVRPLPEGREGHGHRTGLPRHPHRRRGLHERRSPVARRHRRPLPRP